MKIALFMSGHMRTMLHHFRDNIDTIKTKNDGCSVHVFYSFWDKSGVSNVMNDPWHIKIENFEIEDPVTSVVDQHIISCGADSVKGEIEDSSIMEKVIEKSNFVNYKTLSSQYYKKNRASILCNDLDTYDVCFYVRPDLVIKKFPVISEIVKSLPRNFIIVNENYWYPPAKYEGKACNEMLYMASPDSFRLMSSIFEEEEKIMSRLGESPYGEIVTGNHVSKILADKKTDHVGTFNFDYRVIR